MKKWIILIGLLTYSSVGWSIPGDSYFCEDSPGKLGGYKDRSPNGTSMVFRWYPKVIKGKFLNDRYDTQIDQNVIFQNQNRFISSGRDGYGFVTWIFHELGENGVLIRTYTEGDYYYVRQSNCEKTDL